MNTQQPETVAQHKYRFSLDVPLEHDIIEQVMGLAEALDVEVHFLREDIGVLRKTVFFMAYADDANKFSILEKQIKEGENAQDTQDDMVASN